MARRGLRERLLYFALVPAIVVAVLVLGGFALRTTLRIEKRRQETVIAATISLADERVDRLDKFLVAEDNVVLAHVELDKLLSLRSRWLQTAARETPTVRAILVLDADHADHDVLAFASRREDAREDDTFRRLLVQKLIRQMNFDGNVEELRHLHATIEGQSLLVSYWQRTYAGRRYLVVAWHDVPRIVHDLMRRLYDDLGGNSHMNVVDGEGKLVYGPPIKEGGFTVGKKFPTTLYLWSVQVALVTADALGEEVERQRLIELGLIASSGAVAIAGIVIVVVASVRERRLAALRSDFVANVSHELKTPLALVRMFGELLLGERVQTPEKKRQYLEIIVSESERLTALIDNVLDFAKVERGKAGYDFEQGSLGEVVPRAVDVYRYRAEREGVAVNVDVQSGLPDAMIDPRAIELAVINLLDNALKYAKEGGRVDLRVERRGKFVAIQVTDHGPGISVEEQARIFERFVRGKNAGAKQVRGSGIGLALVQHIAESHGGDVTVRSPVTPDGKGSAFTLTIPAGLAAARPAQEAEAPSAVDRHPRESE